MALQVGAPTFYGSGGGSRSGVESTPTPQGVSRVLRGSPLAFRLGAPSRLHVRPWRLHGLREAGEVFGVPEEQPFPWGV